MHRGDMGAMKLRPSAEEEVFSASPCLPGHSTLPVAEVETLGSPLAVPSFPCCPLTPLLVHQQILQALPSRSPGTPFTPGLALSSCPLGYGHGLLSVLLLPLNL